MRTTRIGKLILPESIEQLDNILNDAVLDTLDLRNLKNLRKIGNYFACNAKIREVFFPSSIIEIGNNFMSKQVNIRIIDLSNMKELKKIGNSFMKNLDAQTIKFPDEIESIGENFLYNSNIREIDMSNMTDLKIIPSRFMVAFGKGKNFDSERYIFFPPSIIEIRNGFLTFSHIVKQLDLSNLNNLKRIGDNFFSYSKDDSDRKIILPSSLESIGRNFCRRSKIYGLNLSNLTNLKYIDKGFLSEASVREKITLPKHLKSLIDLSSLSKYNLLEFV